MHSNGKWTHSRKLLICCTLVLYLVFFAGILLIMPLFEKNEEETTYGDLTGRFQSDIFLTYGDQDYAYRSGEMQNILILGVDGTGREGAPLTGQADFLLLLCIDKTNELITPIVIDRDTMTDMRIYGVFGDFAGTDILQICLAHALSAGKVTGGENTLQAVSRLLGGTPIDHYVTMDMSGIAVLNDAVGGVTVTLTEDFSHMDPAMREGETLLLQGEQAELFVRGRMGLEVGTNRARIKRQSQYMSALLQKLAALLSEDAQAMDTLLDAVERNIETDMYRAEMLRTAYGCSGYSRKEPIILQGTSRLGMGGYVEFWLDWDSTAQLLIDTCYEKKE